LEDVKKVVELCYRNLQKLSELSPDIEDLFDRIEARCNIEIILDDAFGKNRRDSQYELMDNHFGQVEQRNFS
jgi:hypothetical protein